MSKSSVRRVAVPITSVAVVAGMMLVGAPANAGTITFNSACVAGSIIGDVQKNVGASMSVDAPTSVMAGETFTYRIKPNASSYPDKDSGATTTNLSRIKYDYELPANTEWVSGAVVPGTAIGLDNVAPSVLLVNDAGQPAANGRVIRLSGNNEVIGNGTNNNAKAEGGIRVLKSKKNLDGSASSGDTWYQLPAIDVTVTALAPGVITPRVRITGNAANHGAMESFSTSLAKASFAGTQWAPTRCTPRDSKDAALNAGGGPLATITVSNPGPVIVDSTTTLNVPATAKTGTAVDLTATVAPAGATGTVDFKDGATIIGTSPVSNGTATLNHAFTTDGSHSITAVYSGDATNRTSTSDASVVEVSTDPVIVDTTTTLNVPGAATTGDSVELFALVADNDNNPAEGGTVQFSIDGTNVGGTVAVVGGSAKLDHAFAVGTHSVGAVYSGAGTFQGSTATAASIVVTDPAPVELNTVTTLTVPATATKGAAVNLSASVKTEAGDPVTSGTVTFMDGTTAIGTAVNVVNGQATLSYPFAQTGDRHITAVYSGASGMKESVSAASTITVSAGTNPGGTGSLSWLGNIFGS